ncbi:MAG: NapC/NirT family cytochrome c [Gammaproteobacteria bacterium]
MGGRIRTGWQWLWRPHSRLAAGSLLLIGIAAAAVAWGGFDAALNYSNTLEFCTSCHEMREYVYAEYRETAHYRSPSGVRAICSDCHVPSAFLPKLLRKIQATFNEVPKHLIGTIDTREKFEARREILAGHVWDVMKASDSRECRACHQGEAMLLADQKPRARGQHEESLTTGETCIDCHQGVAHKLPPKPEEETTPGEEDFTL